MLSAQVSVLLVEFAHQGFGIVEFFEKLWIGMRSPFAFTLSFSFVAFEFPTRIKSNAIKSYSKSVQMHLLDINIESVIKVLVLNIYHRPRGAVLGGKNGGKSRLRN